MRTCPRVLVVLVVILAALLTTARRTAAQDFRCVATATSATDVALVTTAETVIISSGPACAPRQTTNVVIIAWAQLTTGAATTGVTPRIRRGTTASGTLVGEANIETVKAAAGSTEPFWIMAIEDRADVASLEYSLTLTQAAATANGSALQAGIIVLAR